VGNEMLDRLGEALFGPENHDPAAVLHKGVTQQLEVSATDARLRLPLPLARKGDITLKKAGLELIVGAGGHKRTIALPPALAGFEPTGARFEDGALEVSFNGIRPRALADER
jgi:arsenite-transporting ATPase